MAQAPGRAWTCSNAGSQASRYEHPPHSHTDGEPQSEREQREGFAHVRMADCLQRHRIRRLELVLRRLVAVPVHGSALSDPRFIASVERRERSDSQCCQQHACMPEMHAVQQARRLVLPGFRKSNQHCVSIFTGRQVLFQSLCTVPTSTCCFTWSNMFLIAQTELDCARRHACLAAVKLKP